MALVACLLLGSCSDSAAPIESTRTSASAITGGDTTNAMLATTLPEVGVGLLTINGAGISLPINLPDGGTSFTFPGSRCSGALIERSLVLAAAHCFMTNTGPGGFIPNPSVTTMPRPLVAPFTAFFQLPIPDPTITDGNFPGGQFTSFAATAANIHMVPGDIFGNAEGDSQQDLAVAFLPINIGTDVTATPATIALFRTDS